MRRMYSEKELTTIINQVVGEYIEAGALDDSIADAVDAYLVEHPVDVTALEGQTIAPAVINATTSMSSPSGSFTTLNGESNPSVKPIYCHPISIIVNTDDIKLTLSCLIFNNSATAFTKATFKTFIDNLYTQVGATIRIMASGGLYRISNSKLYANAWLYKSENNYGIYGTSIDGSNDAYGFQWNEVIGLEETTFTDGVNKIN